VKSKVALITGASSGIGAATAERLAKADYKVFGTSRRAAPAGQRPFEMLTLDVTSDESVEAVIGARKKARSNMLTAGSALENRTRPRHRPPAPEVRQHALNGQELRHSRPIHIGCGTAPGTLPRPAHLAGPHRVEMNVAAALQQVEVLLDQMAL
jgi:hypothetical protein